jgi:hypothetical protein
VERGSDKHGFRMDDALAAETEGLQRSGHSTHAQEWKDPEPSGEDQPDADYAPSGTLEGGVPDGMTSADVESRSELATFLGASVFPANRVVLRSVPRTRTPRSHLDLLRRPAGRTGVRNVAEVWAALGGGNEQHRS